MARPNKEGLDYFPLDCKMDDKVYMVEVELGLEGFALFIKLLMKIYNENYYIEWNERKAKIFATQNNTNINVINTLINVCLNEGLFDDKLYKKYHILTSNGIQKRYFHSIKTRKDIYIIKEYLTNGIKNFFDNLVNVNINSINDDINPIKDRHNTHSKVKYSKVNNSKEIKEVQNLISKSLGEKPIKKKIEPIEFDREILSWHGIIDSDIESWEKRYPNIEVGLELMKIREYFKENPGAAKDIEERFKGRFGIYIDDWLERAERYKIKGGEETGKSFS